MANNYSVSSFTTLENTGDNVGNGTILSPVYLYITPDPGFVIQASDFSIGTALPPEAISVVFTDTTTALATTNLVKATVELASWYIHGSTAFNIDIDIDGRTHAAKARLNFTTVHVSGVSNITQVLTATNKTAVTSGDITTNTCFLDIQQNTTALVAAFTYTAASGYHLTSTPAFTINSSDQTKWSSVLSDQVYNSDNQLTSLKYSFHYSIQDTTIPLTSGESLIFEAPVLELDRVPCVKISSAYYNGFSNDSELLSGTNFLTLNVYGDENATYTIKIQDNLGLTYNFETDVFTREGSPFSPVQTIFSPSKQIILGRNAGYNQHTIIFPESFPEEATDILFTTTITPTGSTKIKACESTEPIVIRLNKFGEVDYVLTTGVGNFGVIAANNSIKSVLNKRPLSDLTTFVPSQFPNLNTDNNGYFTYSQVLGYTVNGTVASHGSTTATTVGLTATTSSLKLQVGDKVTGTNVPTNAVISSHEESSIVLSIAPSATISGTLTFVRTVGISRKPTETDVKSSSPISNQTALINYPEYSVTRSTTSSKTVVVNDPSGGDFSNLTVGMLIQGANIAGYPTLTSFSKGVINMSTNQSLDAGDVLNFSVAGSKLFIENISVTGAGTSNCKLNVDGYIEKMGNVDVAAEIVLSNFIVAYVAPTITATTATTAVGNTIEIFPLESDTSTNDGLTITEITSSGNGSAKVHPNGRSIKYKAPTTGTSDTISYKISDGISAESSAANIVITLTS